MGKPVRLDAMSQPVSKIDQGYKFRDRSNSVAIHLSISLLIAHFQESLQGSGSKFRVLVSCAAMRPVPGLQPQWPAASSGIPPRLESQRLPRVSCKRKSSRRVCMAMAADQGNPGRMSLRVSLMFLSAATLQDVINVDTFFMGCWELNWCASLS